MHSVLLIDDDERFRKSVRAFLQKEFGFLCAEFADVDDAVQKLPYLKPDLVILEFPMGIEATYQLRKMLPRTPIILFTMHESCRSSRLA